MVARSRNYCCDENVTMHSRAHRLDTCHQQQHKNRRAARNVSSHFEYLEKRSRGVEVTWQLVRGDLTAHP